MPDESNTTTIEIQRETWQDLNTLKEGPGDSFDDVIRRMLEDYEE